MSLHPGDLADGWLRNQVLEPKKLLRNSSPIRMAFGILGVVRPDLLCLACGISALDNNVEARYLMRLFAALRDLLLGITHVTAPAGTDAEAESALKHAAITGLLECGIMASEWRRRGGISGALRAGLLFAVTDGVGFSVGYLLRNRKAAPRVGRRRSMTSRTDGDQAVP